MNTTIHTSALQAEQLDDLTWAMSVLASGEYGDEDHAEWMLNTLVSKGATNAIRQAASSALLGGRLGAA